MSAKLFESITLRGLTIANRIVVAPMCQYSAVDGSATDWHLFHLPNMALSGAGLFITEATHVEARGRITPDCLGLYSEKNEAALVRPLEVMRKYSATPIAIQLAHAGRKASTRKPWSGRGYIQPADGGWKTVGPSPVAWDDKHDAPEELDRAEMLRILDAFVASTRRADRLGIDAIELHAAHGYLLSSFLSPLANRRGDAFGGSFANRARYPLEVFEAMRAAWPDYKPMGVRLNGTDWLDGGIISEESVAFARALADLGCDFVDVSSGGNAPARAAVGPGYQVPFAERIRAETGMRTMAVGKIQTAGQAERIVGTGQADFVAVARSLLNDPHWVWHAAEDLGGEVAVPPQYERGKTRDGVGGTLEGAAAAPAIRAAS